LRRAIGRFVAGFSSGDYPGASLIGALTATLFSRAMARNTWKRFCLVESLESRRLMHGGTEEVGALVAAAEDEGNTPPVISHIETKSVEAGLELRFFVEATDADVPAQLLTFSLVGAPAGMVIDSLSGLVTWTPPANSQGDLISVTVRVTDSAGGSDEQAFDVIVIPQPQTQGFQVVNGDLIISGAAGDDRVGIEGTGVAGQFRIFGTLGNEMVSGVTGDIGVKLGDGADQLTMNLVYAAGDINIDMGAGDDFVALGRVTPVSTAQHLSVELGEGNDGLIGSQLFIGQSQTFRGNAGNDNIALTGRVGPPFWLGTSSGQETGIIGGDGDDTIEVSYSFMVGGWTIHGGEGNDALRLRASSALIAGGILGGSGDDHLIADTCFLPGALSLTGNAGSDWIEYRNSIGLIQTGILGSDGHDLIEVGNVTVNTLRIDGAVGNDTVAVRASLLAQLFADLGDHDDALTVESNLVHGSAELHGGLGMSDWLTDHGNLFHGAIRKRTFEMFAR
jgi:hypothetical protein